MVIAPRRRSCSSSAVTVLLPGASAVASDPVCRQWVSAGSDSIAEMSQSMRKS
jgi:hypothetical protein